MPAHNEAENIVDVLNEAVAVLEVLDAARRSAQGNNTAIDPAVRR